MSNNIQAKIEQLRAELREHDRQYYVLATQTVSDLEYDQLLQQLVALEQANPQYFDPNSPSMRVGGEPLEGLQQVKHRVPMLSIENTYSESELRDFVRRTQEALGEQKSRWVVEWKIDGVAASLVYKNGQLTQAITRGNGEIGDDITHNIRTVRSLPAVITENASAQFAIPADIELRGEVYMDNADLVTLNQLRIEAGETAFKNTRNVTAGTIRLLDAKIAAQRFLRFFTHGIGYCPDNPFRCHTVFLTAVESWGIPITPKPAGFDNVEDLVSHCNERIQRIHELDFEVDGLVIKLDDFAQRDELGMRSKSPRWLIAYKIEKYEAETTMLDISIQVGKTGAITPVGLLEPVQLAGTTVSRCSLHNFDEIQRKDIRIGDVVVVEKAGKIIPHIVRVEKHRRESDFPTFPIPTHCPACHTALVRDEGGVYVRCPSDDCPAQWRQRLRYFATRDCMDIEGLGDKLIELLVEHKLVNNFEDLYNLMPEAVAALPRQGKTSAKNLVDQIEASKSRELSAVLNAISMRHVGKRTSSTLAAKFGTIQRLQQASVEELAVTDEVGQIIAQSVYDFLHQPYGQRVIQQLLAAGCTMEQTTAPSSDASAKKFDALTFVLTGSLSKPRQYFEELIEAAGGKTSSSVSKKTDYLLAGKEAGSKLDKAKKLNVTVIDEATLEKMLTDD